MQSIIRKPATTSWLVEAKNPSTGWTKSFRWYRLADAKRCAKDFRTCVVTITEQPGRMTFEGWKVTAQQGGAA